MINLISGFILVLISQYNSMTTINHPQNTWAYNTLENCKEAGDFAIKQFDGYKLWYVCLPSPVETGKND